MHYLGLDHCGHMRGPNSNIMKSKQKEMDSIIHQIILSISKQDEILNTNTLFVFMSDHGMTESGNHGGASTVETDAVLALFAPSKIHIDSKPTTLSKHDPKIERIIKSAFDTAPRVRQLDLVPTLATTLGIPIPIDNQGTLLSPFLQTFMNKEQYLASLYTNVHQFQQSMYNQQKGNVMSTIQNDQNDQNDKNNDKNKDNKKDFNITTTTMKDYFDQSFTKISDSSTSTIDKIQLLESYLLSFSSILDTKFSSSSSSYSSMISMYIGIALLIIGTLSLLHQLYQIVTVTEIETETETETTIATTTAFSSKMESAANLPRNNNTAMYRFGPKHIDEWYILCIIPVFNILALTSSSLIENEHAVWYLTITTWYFLRLRRTFTTITTNFTHVLRLFACLLLLCILRSTTSVINFSKLNHLNEPKFISSTAVIMLPPIDNPIDMYYVLVYVALTMCIALGIMYRQHVARKNATLFMFMSSLFIFVGFICVGVRLCFKSEQLIVTDNETMNEWSIIIPPMCSFILILLSIFINTEQQSTKNTNTKNHINDGTNEPNASNASNASNELNASNASNFSFSYLLLISVVIIVMYLHRSKRIIILLEIFVLLLSTTSILTDTTEKNNAIYLPNILIYLYLGQCFFYSLGNSHTMGTADFAGAYTGTTSFNKYRTGSLACIIVYTGPLLSYFSAISYMSHVVHHIKTTTMIQNRKNGDTSYVIWICCVLFLMYRMVMLITCTLLTLLFQHHLFVWSVFAPKFIYEVGHTVVLVGFVLFVWCVYYISNLLQTRSNRIGTKKTI